MSTKLELFTRSQQLPVAEISMYAFVSSIMPDRFMASANEALLMAAHVMHESEFAPLNNQHYMCLADSRTELKKACQEKSMHTYTHT